MLGVAPFMGAWIEITVEVLLTDDVIVAPFMGAWIEMHRISPVRHSAVCRSLHGGVD